MSDIFRKVEIFGVIEGYRYLHMDDDEIIVDLMELENLTREESQEYLRKYDAENRVTT